MDFVHNPYRCGPPRVGKYGPGLGRSLIFIFDAQAREPHWSDRRQQK